MSTARVRGDELGPGTPPNRGRSGPVWQRMRSGRSLSPEQQGEFLHRQHYKNHHHKDYIATRLESRSRSPSPNMIPNLFSDYYGTTQLEHRSRSPSPSGRRSLPPHHQQKCRTRAGRRLPQTPNKPSTLNLSIRDGHLEPGIMNFPVVSRSPTVPQTAKSPGSINFPKLNASPTHAVPNLQMPPPPPGWRNSPNSTPARTHMPTTTVSIATLGLSLAPSIECGAEKQLLQRGINRGREQFQYADNTGITLPLQQKVEPLSFEAAVAIGRGNRQLPLPMPNGYKPGQSERERERLHDRDREEASIRAARAATSGAAAIVIAHAEPRSDTDEDDWC